MATKTARTTKTTSTKKTSTRKSSKASVLAPLVKEKKTATKTTTKIKKVGENKFKFVVFLYEDRGKDKVAVIDGLADFVENFCVNSTSDYNIKEKEVSRIYNDVERLDGTMDNDIEKKRKEFLEKT